MVYRNYHDCNRDCNRLVAYIRIDGKWTKIGHYGSECKKFEALDLQQEEQDRLLKQRLENIKLEIRKAKNKDYS